MVYMLRCIARQEAPLALTVVSKSAEGQVERSGDFAEVERGGSPLTRGQIEPHTELLHSTCQTVLSLRSSTAQVETRKVRLARRRVATEFDRR